MKPERTTPTPDPTTLTTDLVEKAIRKLDKTLAERDEASRRLLDERFERVFQALASQEKAALKAEEGITEQVNTLAHQLNNLQSDSQTRLVKIESAKRTEAVAEAGARASNDSTRGLYAIVIAFASLLIAATSIVVSVFIL